ncbi:MAG: ATP-dependent zinc metalloprotease FtsH [Eubacteriales bacterium]|nr:ATP-dependent zinc metalloprotease FtsH [Eubacteriales bacterium]
MKKSSRGLMSYVVLIGTFLLIAILLNGSLSDPVNKRIEYPELLQMIQEDQVARVAIRNNYLVGLKKNTTVAAADFPERAYDFETTIGDDFIETVRQMEATRQGKPLDEVSVSDLKFTVEYRAPVVTPWWYDFLPFLLVAGIFMALWYFMMRAQSGGSNKVMSFGKSRARVQDPGKNKVTFADVAGADEEKEELKEMVDFLRNPRAYTELGARIPKGVLLVGPPGTGKTLLAKAVAGEAGVPFFSISGSDFVEMFVGVGASRVRDLFDQAKKAAPAIVFIDEIDAVGRHRGAGLGGGHDEREQTLNQLLVEMDGFAVNEGVIVMAATNRRDILDPALLRPGRFDRQVTVNYPDMDGRVAILKVHSRGKPLDPDVDLVNVAKRVPFATGAELENIMNEAAILAARARKKTIDQQMLVDAIARVQMGPEKRSHKVTERDRRMVAIHESGHAVVEHFIPGSDEVHLVTIVPRGQAAGHTLSLPSEENDLMTQSQLMARIAGLLGGHAAEQLGLGEFSTGATSDLQRATELCRRMVTQFGMSDKIGPVYLDSDQEVFVGMEFGQSRGYSEEVAARIDAEVRRLLDEAYAMAVKAISDHRDRFDALVDALLKMDTVSRKEFKALMETGEIPEGLEDDDKPRAAADIPAPEKKPWDKKPPVNPDKPELPEDILLGSLHDDDKT